MNLTDVIENLVEERGLDREKVISIVCDGMLAAYRKKFPQLALSIEFNKRIGEPEISVKKNVVTTVANEDSEISLRRARGIVPTAQVGDAINVPLEEKIGRIEILVAKQIIAHKIKEVEQSAVADEFKDKVGAIVSGVIHKREQAGMVIKVGDVMALLPTSLSIPEEVMRPGVPVRALLKEVLMVPRGDFQLILDRASAEFIKKLLELEIPEIFEGIVEIKKIVRAAGYKTKAIVMSNNKEIDPVGTCVGVGGVRIKPILRELGGEKIDLIEWNESLEALVKNSLKPAEIDKVAIVEHDNYRRATVWLAEDQRSLAIGKMGRNIALAARLAGVEINLQEISKKPEPSSEEEDELND